jgi:hypothetical protein
VSILIAVALLAACHHPKDRPSAVVDADPPAASLTAQDTGAAMLADVDNARAAIAARDSMAATNDLDQAVAYAVKLPDVTSNLYPNEAVIPDRRVAHAGPVAAPPLTAFDAEVTLTSAQSELAVGDLAGADAQLTVVQRRTPPRLVPADLPLLRADESLGLARIAVESEHAGELKTQLEIAEAALDAYRGRPHAADAKALAAAIDRTLKQPGSLDRLQSDQLDLWSGLVDGWA